MTLKPKFLSFMTEVNSSNENETKSNIFSWVIFKSNIIFHWSQILKYFNDIHNWHLSISLQD